MPLDKVFISYSAKNCAPETCVLAPSGAEVCPSGGCERRRGERLFVESLAQCLQPTYEVVWDQNGTTLLPGIDWRKTLYVEFARCRAAIVVLTQSSLESAYVPLEAMVLVWRWLIDPTFLVIPVYFSPLDENTVKSPNSRFYGVGLENLQGLKHQSGHEQQTYAAIKARLTQIAPSVPLESLVIAHRLAALLEKVTPPELDAAARVLGHCDEWDPVLPQPFLLALALLRSDLPTAVSALAHVVDSLDLEPRKRLHRMITPLWVSLPAAAALQRERERPIVLNATWDKTAHHYALRAWSHQTREVLVFPIVAADDGTGTEIYSAIRHSLQQTILVEFPDLADEELESALEWLSREGPHIYVCIHQGSGVSVEVLASLQAKLRVRIIYLRPDASAETVGPDAYVIEPLVDTQAEKIARQQYVSATIALKGISK